MASCSGGGHLNHMAIKKKKRNGGLQRKKYREFVIELFMPNQLLQSSQGKTKRKMKRRHTHAHTYALTQTVSQTILTDTDKHTFKVSPGAWGFRLWWLSSVFSTLPVFLSFSFTSFSVFQKLVHDISEMVLMVTKLLRSISYWHINEQVTANSPRSR